jgi:hypothetical protein
VRRSVNALQKAPPQAQFPLNVDASGEPALRRDLAPRAAGTPTGPRGSKDDRPRSVRDPQSSIETQPKAVKVTQFVSI